MADAQDRQDAFEAKAKLEAIQRLVTSWRQIAEVFRDHAETEACERIKRVGELHDELADDLEDILLCTLDKQGNLVPPASQGDDDVG